MTLGTPESCHRARGCLPDTPEFYPDAQKTLPDAAKFESDARELSWDASEIRPGDREFCWGAPEPCSRAQKIRRSARKFCPDVPGFDSGAREIDSGRSGRMSRGSGPLNLKTAVGAGINQNLSGAEGSARAVGRVPSRGGKDAAPPSISGAEWQRHPAAGRDPARAETALPRFRRVRALGHRR